MNESGELQDLLTKIEVIVLLATYYLVIKMLSTCNCNWVFLIEFTPMLLQICYRIHVMVLIEYHLPLGLLQLK